MGESSSKEKKKKDRDHREKEESKGTSLLIKQPDFFANDLLDKVESDWYVAGGEISRMIMSHPGRIWGTCHDIKGKSAPTFYYNVVKPCENLYGFPTDGSYGTLEIAHKRIDAFADEYGRLDETNNYVNVGSMGALEGQVLFYDYDFKKIDTETRTEQIFHLADQREICGFAFLPAPLKYYPIGKNFIETEGPFKPYLLFAIPEDIIMHVQVDGEEIGENMKSATNLETTGNSFLKWKVKSSDNKQLVIPIFVTGRQEKAIKWPQHDVSATCLRKFSELFKSLTSGKHNVEVYFQFSYKTDKVYVVSATDTDIVSQQMIRNRWHSFSKHEYRFHMGSSSMRQVSNSSLILRHTSPDSMQLSAVLCSGAFNVVIPVKSNLCMCMYFFYGFNDEQSCSSKVQEVNLSDKSQKEYHTDDKSSKVQEANLSDKSQKEYHTDDERDEDGDSDGYETGEENVASNNYY